MNEDLETIRKRTDDAENEVKELTESFNKLKALAQNGHSVELIEGNIPDELTELITQNTKLKHRLAILKRVRNSVSYFFMTPVCFTGVKLPMNSTKEFPLLPPP
ncbi:hypothetical protein J6590_055638 [Homalodisca vitripennis]|nr:hypothetical protein J6590_055638 [Homalodisca vitripennis]